MFAITQCPLCTSNLVVDVIYLDDKNIQVHSVTEVPLSYVALPPKDYEHTHPVIVATYCPLHRILFKAETDYL